MGSNANEFVYTIKAQYAGDTDMRKLQDDLNNISNIKSFEKLSGDIAKTEAALSTAEEKAATYKQTMEETGSKSSANAYAKAETDVNKLSATLQAQNATLESNAAALKAAGISVSELSIAEKSLSASAGAGGGLLAAESMLGVRSFDAIKAEITSLETAYATLAASGVRSDAEIAAAHEALLLKTAALNAEMATGPGLLSQAGAKISHEFVGIGAAIAGVFAVEKVGEYIKKMYEVADEELTIGARLKLITSSEEELHATEEALYAASQKTGSSFAKNADTFAKMGTVLLGTGISSKNLVSIIDVLDQTLVVSSASAERAASFMGAFSFAMESGAISGRQFRTMLQDNPEFMKRLADSLDTNVEGLQKMAKAGELTRDIVITAIHDMADKVHKDFESMPTSMERAMEKLHNATNKIVDDANKAAGGTVTVSQAIERLAKTIEINKGVIQSIFSGTMSAASWPIGGISNTITVISALKEVLKGNLSYMDAMTMSAEQLEKRMGEIAEATKKQTPAHKDNVDELKKYNDLTDSLKDKFKDMAIEVQKTYDQIGQNNFDLAKSIGDINRSGMTAGDAWTSLRTEANNYARDAQRAAAAGDFTLANKLMKDAVSDAKSLSNEVEVNGEKMSARNAKIEEMTRLTKIANGILLDQVEAEKVAAAAAVEKTKIDPVKLVAEMPDVAKILGISATEATNKWNTALDGLGAKSKDVFDAIFKQQLELPAGMEKFNDAHKAAFDLFEKEGEASIGKIKEMLSAGLAPGNSVNFSVIQSTIDQDIKELERLQAKQAELPEGAEKYKDAWSATWKDFLTTGLDDISTLSGKLDELTKDRNITVHVNQVSDGGSSTGGFASGGDPFYGGLRGYGGGDRRLILVEDGEHVIRKEAVASLGHDYFQKFNLGNFPRSVPSISMPNLEGFAAGGPIGGASGGDTYHLTTNFHGNQTPMSQSTAKENAKMILTELARMHRRSS